MEKFHLEPVNASISTFDVDSRAYTIIPEKKGYNIKFDKQQSLFGLPASKKWCILANYDDKTLLRNKFSSVLGKEIFNSEWNPYSYSVDVVWNGEFRGNYTLSEKNTIDVWYFEIR